MEVRGKGTKVAAQDCNIRSHNRNGVLLCDGASAAFEHITCTENGAHGIAVLSSACLEASHVTSSSDGHHGLYVHGRGVFSLPFWSLLVRAHMLMANWVFRQDMFRCLYLTQQFLNCMK